LKEAALKCIL